MEIIIPVFFVLLVQAVIFGFLCQSLCEKKGHEGGFWIGFFFGILGLLYVVGLPDKSGLKNIPTVIRRDSKPCPYCGGELEGQYELCKHCRSPLSYVDGIPCKPGLENSIKEDIERVAKERYESQELTFSTRDGVDYVNLKCYCGQSLSTKCTNIGSNKQCQGCGQELVIRGGKEYVAFLEEKKESKKSLIVFLTIFVMIMIMIIIAHIDSDQGSTIKDNKPSRPSVQYRLALMVRSSSQINSWDEMVRLSSPSKKKRVGVLKSSPADEFATRNGGDQIEIVRFDGAIDAMFATSNGYVDATLQNDTDARNYAEKDFNGRLRLTSDQISWVGNVE